MAAGYNSLKVTRTATGVSWSFNATAVSGAWDQCRVVCENYSASSSGLNHPASVKVTGSAAATDPAYRTGRRVYTVRQYVRASSAYDWVAEDSITVTVTWDVTALRVVSDGSVKICANIQVKAGDTIKNVVGVYSVKNGVVKPGI